MLIRALWAPRYVGWVNVILRLQEADYIKNAGSNKQGRKEDVALLKMMLDLQAIFYFDLCNVRPRQILKAKHCKWIRQTIKLTWTWERNVLANSCHFQLSRHFKCKDMYLQTFASYIFARGCKLMRIYVLLETESK